MHAAQVDIDAALVRRLLASQFPAWADLPLERVRSAGTVNAIFRLGDEMAVRLPLVPGDVDDVEHELQWLPRLAPQLPLAIPAPIARGVPGEGYPSPWAVHRWLEGENPTLEGLADPCQCATELAEFILALRRIDPAGGPVGRPNDMLVRDDSTVRSTIAALDGVVDSDAATAAWESSVQAPLWEGAPVWLHTDLLPGNLLTVDGKLTAVIDFGGVGVGDPAWDLLPAWSLFTGTSRAVFREALSVDDATWARGRGYALSKGLIALPYYQTTNPEFAALARHMIDAVLADLEERDV